MSTRKKFSKKYSSNLYGSFFDCLDHIDPSVPEMTIEEFSLAACWSVLPAGCGTKSFWETMTCALTKTKRNEALKLRSQLMNYTWLCREHDVNIIAQASIASKFLLKGLMKYAKSLSSRKHRTAQASFFHNMESWTRVRKFCVPEKGQMGWVPIEAQQDDVIYVFEGVNLPYVLRRTADDDSHTIIGHCYIHGVTLGEVTTSKKISSEDIILR